MRPFHLAWFSVPTTILVLCIAVVAYHWKAIGAEYDLWDSGNSKNASYFYWPTAEVIKELEAVRIDLNTIANGSTGEPDALSFDIDVLISGINIIVRPSELNDGYKQLPGYSDDGRALDEFVTVVLPAIKSDISGAEAQALLPELQDAYDAISRISKAAEIQDNRLKERSFKTIRAAHIIILVTAGMLVCAILSSVLISIGYWWAIVARTRAVVAAEAAVADKISFLAMISHELRTPLQVIVSALDVLERQHDVKTKNELTGRIRRAANSLAVQLRDMLTLARGQTGYIELQPGVFEAGELIEDVIADYQAMAEAKHLELRKTRPDEPIFVVADGERIARLLHNLISNAVKYTPSGNVQVELAPFNEKFGELFFRVTDTGPGLPPRMLENQVNTTGLLSFGGGRGIGLSVVQTLLHQLGARMTASSPIDGGSIIDLSIPAVLTEGCSREAPNAQKRALVVADHPDLLRKLADVLEELEFVTDIAPSGMAALNFVAAHTYSVIFVDLDMPIMTGPELATHLRKTGLQPRTKLIAMSAANYGSRHNLSGFDATISKPIRRQQLQMLMQF